MATTLREGAEIINESLRTLGYDFQIDLTDNNTITDGLNTIGAYPPSQKNIIMEQMNLILQQRNYGVMFDSSKNKFREFLVDMSPNGFGIEDVFHEIIEGTKTLWDGSATAEEIAKDLVSYKKNQVDKFFHTESNSKKFDTTIDERNYEKVFTPYGVTRYIDTRLANLSWSAEFWFMNRVIDIIKSMISNNDIEVSAHHTINNKDGVNDMVETIKSLLAGFSTPTNLYNKGVYDKDLGTYRKVVNMTVNESDKFIITTPEYMARLKVQGYSNAFNLSQYELEGRIMYVPAGTELGEIGGEKVLAVVLDRRAIVVGIRRWLATTFFVPNTGWINHFLNVEILEGYNTIFNAVAITGDAVDTFYANGVGATIKVTTTNADFMSDFYTDGELVAELEHNGEIHSIYQGCSYFMILNDRKANVKVNDNTVITGDESAPDSYTYRLPNNAYSIVSLLA